MNQRVVITGMGAVTSLGFGKEEFWQSVRTGQSGISLIERIDVADLDTWVGAEIKNFDPTLYIDKKEARRTDRYAQYALAAAQLALDDSGLDLDREDRDRLGVILGTGIGGMETLEGQHSVLLEKGPGRISPFCIPMMIPNMAAGLVAIRFGLRGFVETVITACASSTNALGDAFRLIRSGSADIMFAGGTEAPLTRLAIAGFCANKALSSNHDPSTACRPFDQERDGFVMGEGAGMLILEELSHARARSATIIAEVTGYGSTNDAFHITASPETGEGEPNACKWRSPMPGCNQRKSGISTPTAPPPS
jgi:3-oxoacyl-[acyl-carrier-protein] synthase II